MDPKKFFSFWVADTPENRELKKTLKLEAIRQGKSLAELTAELLHEAIQRREGEKP